MTMRWPPSATRKSASFSRRSDLTLMNIIGCLDRPTEGQYVLDGTPVEAMDDDALAAVRNKKIGFVFQTFRSDADEHHRLPRSPDRRAVRPRRNSGRGDG